MPRRIGDKDKKQRSRRKVLVGGAIGGGSVLGLAGLGYGGLKLNKRRKQKALEFEMLKNRAYKKPNPKLDKIPTPAGAKETAAEKVIKDNLRTNPKVRQRGGGIVRSTGSPDLLGKSRFRQKGGALTIRTQGDGTLAAVTSAAKKAGSGIKTAAKEAYQGGALMRSQIAEGYDSLSPKQISRAGYVGRRAAQDTKKVLKFAKRLLGK